MIKKVLIWFIIQGLCSSTFIGTAQVSKRFSLLDASQTKIHFNNFVKDDKERNILTYANFYGGAGIGVIDINNDGLQDLYFAGNMVPDKLYLNKGNFEFEDISLKAGIKDDGGWSTGVTIADVNNDGYLDIYVSRELYDSKPEWRTNLLYLNNGDGTFTESAKKLGVADSQRTRHATFLDYDKDGFLDLFLLTQPPNPASYSIHFGETLLKPEYHLKLLKNINGNSFEDVSKKAGIDLTGFPNGVSASDLNNDGWTDLYVANDFAAPDFLFLNNGDGTFTNVMDTALMHIPYYSMGVDIADINNDGLLDIFVVDMVAEDNFRLKSNMSGMNPKSFWKVVDDGGHYQYMYNSLQLNNGNMTFSDVAQLTGMAATDWSWANLIADFDNDGLKDTYVTNGLLHDIRNTDADKAVASFVNKTTYDWVQKHPDGGELNSIWDILDLEKVVKLIPSQPIKNFAYKNKGNLEFEKFADEWGLAYESFSNGAAYADLDNDGDLDIIVNNINNPAFVFRNNSEQLPNSNFLRIRLEDSNHRSVFGTRITLYSGNEVQTYETTNVRGIYSTSEPTAHFGLGNLLSADSLVVNWPNGRKTVKKTITANQTLVLNMDSAEDEALALVYGVKSEFFTNEPSSYGLNHQHVENSFDDFSKQVLLPHKLSQFGPALATGDVNNDGLDDIFVGGATGYSPALYIQNQNGTFIKSDEVLWQKEAVYEDVDALFVDINGDGFMDLYVVSGGNEFTSGDERYVDRLYLNDTKGKFQKSEIQGIEGFSGSKIAVADFDGDGDLDFFVGSRHVPHQYPLPATSMLLVNENGKLINKTATIAPEFKDLGMVTAAVWADYDGNGTIDLIVVGEWMPITIFTNTAGKLSKTQNKNLEATSGWWFSIAQGDFDQDGDIDFIIGNLGLNYKYKTSKETPFDIYYDDFDGNGSGDIVLGYYNNDKHYPLRGFSCSSEQIPSLKTQIKKYDLFASLEIDQVYGKKKLDNSLHYVANTFASSYVENLGNGNFKIVPLPVQAQFSNVNDIKVSDFNKDGSLDALIIGNLFVSEIETPRNDAGTGLLLLGDGKGGFEPVNAQRSGFFARGDAKKVQSIKIGGQEKLIIGNNNDLLQVFNVNNQ